MKVSNTIKRNAHEYEQRIRNLAKEGLSVEQIGINLSISPSSVSRYADYLGIKIGRKRRSVPNDGLPAKIEEMIQMRQEQKTLQEIGEHYGVSRERIRQIMAKYAPDIAIQSRFITGEKHQCRVCGQEYHGRTKTCSPACASVSKKRDKWNRDKMMVALGLRNKGYTWAEVGHSMCPGKPEGSFRIERHAEWLLSTEEFHNTFKKRCNSLTKTACCASEGTREKDQTKPLPDGLYGPEKTYLDSLVNWMRSRL